MDNLQFTIENTECRLGFIRFKDCRMNTYQNLQNKYLAQGIHWHTDDTDKTDL